jgi:hypothetical protein
MRVAKTDVWHVLTEPYTVRLPAPRQPGDAGVDDRCQLLSMRVMASVQVELDGVMCVHANH